MKHLLPIQTFAPMLDPGIRAVCAVLPKLNPLATNRTEDTVGLDLADERIGSQSCLTLLGIAPSGFLSRDEIPWRKIFERHAGDSRLYRHRHRRLDACER